MRRNALVIALLGSALWAGLVAAQTLPAEKPVQPATNADPTATLITLHLHNALPEDAFAALGKQVGVPFAATPDTLWDQPDSQKEISLDLDNVPFWEALRQLSDKTGIYPAPATPNSATTANNFRRITLARSTVGWDARKAQICGPFLLCANGAGVLKSLTFAQSLDPVNTCTLQFTLLVDPRLQFTETAPSFSLQEVVDEKGASLLPKERIWSSSVTIVDLAKTSWSTPLFAYLRLPPQAGTRVAILKGAIEATLAGKTETWEVPEVLNANNVTKTIGGIEFTLHSVKLRDKTNPASSTNYYEAEATARKVGPTAINDLFSLLRQAALLDANGKVYRNLGASSLGSNNGLAVAKFTFLGASSGRANPAPREPAKWVLEVPVDTRAVTVPVTLKDLPLP